MTQSKRIVVEIMASSLTFLRHHVYENLSIFKTLRDKGIPVDGVIELRGVTHGRLTTYHKLKAGELTYVYEWEDGPAVVPPKPAFNLDDV